MTYWYADSSMSWPIEVSSLQRSVAFCSSKCVSKYWRSWLSDRFGVLSSTFLRVRIEIMALRTLYNFWFLIICILCFMNLMHETHIYQLSLLICLTNLTCFFSSFLNKLVLKFNSRRMGEKLLLWPSSALLSAPIAVFLLFSFWSASAVSWSPF